MNASQHEIPNGIPYRVVDAFAWEPYTGNPAGVVLDASGLSDAHMQQIAREINAGATCFVLPPDRPDAAVRFRWFSRSKELRLCGHATIGAAHALLECGRYEDVLRPPDGVLAVSSPSGIVNVRTEYHNHASVKRLYSFDAPDASVQRWPHPPEQFIEHLGATAADLDARLPLALTPERDLIVAFSDLFRLLDLRPDMQKLAAFCTGQRLRGVLCTTTQTLAPSIACQSRFFAPAVGIDEDPVSGSVHGPLAVHLIQSGVIALTDGRALIECAQGEAAGRAGVLRVAVLQAEARFRARVGGACVTTAAGTLTRPK